MAEQLHQILVFHLVLGVAEHARADFVDEDDLALHIDAVDAIPDRLEDRFPLAHDRVQLVLGIGLFGHVDAVAQHERHHLRQVEQAVSPCDDADLAIAMAEADGALLFAGEGDSAQIIFESGLLILGHKIRQAPAHHLVHPIAQVLRRAGIDGENPSLQIVGEYHAQRAFHQLPVARLAGVERRDGLALIGHVDARHDDEVDLARAVGEDRRGPRDQTAPAFAREPVQFGRLAAQLAPRLLEQLESFRPLFVEKQLLGERAPRQLGEGVSGNLLAGAIEAHDASRRVHDQHQRAHGVEHGGDEVALHHQRTLDPLAGPQRVILAA